MEDDHTSQDTKSDCTTAVIAGVGWSLLGAIGLVIGFVMIELLYSELSAWPSGGLTVTIFLIFVGCAGALSYGLYLCHKTGLL